MDDHYLISKETLDKKKIVCPICGHDYIPNGVGPSNNPLLTKALQAFLFISSRYFKKPSKAHDIGYLIVSYMPVVYEQNNYRKVCETRKDVDDLFYDLMLVVAAKSNFIVKPYLKKAAHLYYKAVREGGADSCKHEH